VQDVAEAFRLAVELNVENGIYNLGSGESRSVYDACKIVEERVLGTNDMSERMRDSAAAKQQVSFWANMEKTKRIFNWSPKTSFEQGIKLYIDSLG